MSRKRGALQNKLEGKGRLPDTDGADYASIEIVMFYLFISLNDTSFAKNDKNERGEVRFMSLL
jgi:hypothetical protein